MKTDRRIEKISRDTSNKNNDNFHQILKIVSKFQKIDEKLLDINENCNKIIKSLRNIYKKHDKISENLKKKQLKSMMPSILQSIKEIPLDEMISTIPHSINKINLKNSEEELIICENQENSNTSSHLSPYSSKFQRSPLSAGKDSKAHRKSVFRKTEKIDSSSRSNYSNRKPINNFMMDSSEESREKSKFQRKNNNTNQKNYSLIIKEHENQQMNRINEKKKRLLLNQIRNEERTCSLIEVCKSSQNRLLSSINSNLK